MAIAGVPVAISGHPPEIAGHPAAVCSPPVTKTSAPSPPLTFPLSEAGSADVKVSAVQVAATTYLGVVNRMLPSFLYCGLEVPNNDLT